MHNRKAFLIALLALGIALSAVSCAKQEAETVPEPVEPVTQPPVEEPVAEPEVEVTEEWQEEKPVVVQEYKPTISELNAQGVLQTVYFDFDKSDLSGETRRVLRLNADWMQKNTEYRIVIEGHCDERGTIEYNLALGQRRAQAVRDYLTNMGVAADRMRLVSYGEEKPADPAHSEAAWALNRRAAFVIE
jgi:peptidoglycan-associated lipoprotein